MAQQDRVEIFRFTDDSETPYPWGFRVWFQGKCYNFFGIPNQCATQHSARMRGHCRLRWLKNNTFYTHYEKNK